MTIQSGMEVLSLAAQQGVKLLGRQDRFFAGVNSLGFDFKSYTNLQISMSRQFPTLFELGPIPREVRRSLVLFPSADSIQAFEGKFIPQLDAFLHTDWIPDFEKVETLSSALKRNPLWKKLVAKHYPSARGATGESSFPFFFLWQVLGYGEEPKGIEADFPEEPEFELQYCAEVLEG